MQEVEKLIQISKAQRNKKKIVTVVTGLRTFGMTLVGMLEQLVGLLYYSDYLLIKTLSGHKIAK